MKRLMAIVILASAALAVGACNNGTTKSGGAASTSPTMATSAEPTMSLESPLASDMPSVDASTTP